MASLRELVESLGYADVRTHLQSGNVVYTAEVAPERAARAIERALEEQVGVSARVLVRTQAELADVVARNPLAEVASNGSRYFVIFLSEPPDRKRLGELDAAAFEPDLFRPGKRELYVWCPNGLQATKLTHAFWEGKLGVTATARNWNTVTKLAELGAA